METKHTATDPKRENSTATMEENNTTPEEQHDRTVMTEEELGNVAGGMESQAVSEKLLLREYNVYRL